MNLVWLGLLVAGFALIQVLVAAGVLNLFYIQILEQIGINIILAVGLNLIVGFSGQFSLGHAGFMAIGAYSAAILGSKSPTYGAFFGAMVLGALIAGVVALIVGVPTLRLKGDYLAIATLGVSGNHSDLDRQWWYSNKWCCWDPWFASLYNLAIGLPLCCHYNDLYH